MWYLFLILSVAVMLMSFLYIPISKRINKKTILPINILFCTLFAANSLVLFPIYFELFQDEGGISLYIKSMLLSMHHSIRLFIVDSDFEMVRQMVPQTDSLLYHLYTCYTAALFLLSPILTFGFVFLFFKNLSAHRKYAKNYRKNVCVFSKLNTESVTMATSIKSKFSDSAIVFSNVNECNSDISGLHQKAKAIGSICFEKDILELNLSFHSRKQSITFFLLDKEESNNLKYALAIAKKYNKREHTQMYVLSNKLEGELMLNQAPMGKIKIRRVGNIRLMIYNLLQNSGHLLFEEAKKLDKTSEIKHISAVIVGLGKNGSEMTKSLAWFCQMEGYHIEINAFDASPFADDFFSGQCPELMDEKHNNHFEDPGESQYNIRIHSSINVNGLKFNEEIKKLDKTTYVFISLGKDEMNIRAGVKIRMLFEQLGIKPRIQAVVENPERKATLLSIKNHSGQPYDIDFVGDVNEIYSYENIINSTLEKEALSRHLCWNKEENFWNNEYNYRSSMASVLHKKMKKFCGISGIEKAPAERTEEEKQVLRLMEHRRWNAYMRSEGYSYAKERNNLAKTHNCLVTFDLLSQKDKEKDDN